MGAVATYSSLEMIGDAARPYPAQYLDELETGLCLFGAAFLGHNDAIHFYENGLETTVVDTDAERLEEMRELYPDGWSFVAVDAWEYAHAAAREEIAFDAVSVDVFTGDAEVRAIDDLALWTSIATELVTVTITDRKRYVTPPGWSSGMHLRGPGVFWLVLRRER